MALHPKDYVFEEDFAGKSMNTSGTANVTESILEVDFDKLDDSTWLGY